MRLLLSFFAVIVLLPLAACGDDTPTYRYRMTVEVETPDGLRTGSSVIEVETARSGGIPNYGSVQNRYRGEAVAVDLGDAGVLFALLRSKQRVDWAGNIMFLVAPPGVSADGDRFRGRYQNMLAMRREVSLPQFYKTSHTERRSTGIPMLVTFEDLSDPTTIIEVDPDNLAATFGDGYSLKRVAVQMTNEPVTVGIVNRLGWLDNLAAYRTIPDNPFTNTLPPEVGALRAK
ncbi:hypothetical protein [Erythrobacter sp.]|uniref:hypothetical protein n=1 Tax=Erythrobacter sp. TaxID=1042 RepID=UPI00311E57F4